MMLKEDFLNTDVELTCTCFERDQWRDGHYESKNFQYSALMQ